MINGQAYDWLSIEIMTSKGMIISAKSIDYSDKRDVASVYGKGSRPLGFGHGNYEATGALAMSKEEWLEFQASLVVTGDGTIYGHRPFPIVVKYKNNDQPIPQIDVLKGCKLTEVKDARKQGDTESNVELSFNITGGINRNGVEAVA